jgi:hypothetical protein
MAVDFKNLLLDPRLLDLFRRQSDLDEGTFAEYLKDNDPAMFWQWLELEKTLVVHYAEGAGETCFGVYGWGGLYFGRDESCDLLEGPFVTPEEAASNVGQLGLADFADTWGMFFEVRSMLPDEQALSMIAQLISKGETLSLNGVNYRRESSGYVKA